MISESSGTTSEIVETEMGADEPVMGETEQTKEREPQKESADQHIVHLNTATLTELMELPGIGQTYGLRIIEFRENNGAFTSVEQLMQVKGIGPKTLEKLKPYLEL